MDSHTTMLEKIARAMSDSDFGKTGLYDIDTLWMLNRRQAMRWAIASLEAIKELGPEPLQVFESLLDTQGHQQTLQESWALIIDAILKEKSDG